MRLAAARGAATARCSGLTRLARTLGRTALAAAGLAFCGLAAAQTYPSQPVTLVVPYAAGGSTDVLGRIVAQSLTRQTGQAFVVNNVVGAAATLGAGKVAAAKPDGQTLLLAGSSALVMAPHLFDKLAYDPLTSFAPIGKVATSTYVVMARAGSGIDSFEALVARGRSRPGSLNYGSSGVGSGLHLTLLLMLDGTGVQATHIPFTGIAPAWNALLGGHVDFLLDSPSGALPMMRSGKAVPLVVTSPQRAPELPEVPTLREKGLKDFDSVAWFTLLAPHGTPAPVLARLRQLLVASLADPQVIASLKAAGFNAADEAPAAVSDEIRRENVRWGQVIASHHIRLDEK